MLVVGSPEFDTATAEWTLTKILLQCLASRNRITRKELLGSVC